LEVSNIILQLSKALLDEVILRNSPLPKRESICL